MHPRELCNIHSFVWIWYLLIGKTLYLMVLMSHMMIISLHMIVFIITFGIFNFIYLLFKFNI
jgi:hypothetical protein